jgi:hypothetical protein
MVHISRFLNPGLCGICETDTDTRICIFQLHKYNLQIKNGHFVSLSTYQGNKITLFGKNDSRIVSTTQKKMVQRRTPSSVKHIGVKKSQPKLRANTHLTQTNDSWSVVGRKRKHMKHISISIASYKGRQKKQKLISVSITSSKGWQNGNTFLFPCSLVAETETHFHFRCETVCLWSIVQKMIPPEKGQAKMPGICHRNRNAFPFLLWDSLSVVNSAKNDPARKGTGKNAQQEHKRADLPAGKKKWLRYSGLRKKMKGLNLNPYVVSTECISKSV